MQRRQTVSFVDEKGGRLRGRCGKQVNMPSEEQRRERDRGSRGRGRLRKKWKQVKVSAAAQGSRRGPVDSACSSLVTLPEAKTHLSSP